MMNFSILLCILFVLVAYLDVSLSENIDEILSQTHATKNFDYLLQTITGNPALLNQKDQKGLSPLLLAVVNHQMGVAQELLRKGADVNTVENDGWSALMFAAYFGNAEIVNALLAAGANPLLSNKAGKTAHELALTREHVAVAKAVGDASVRFAITTNDQQATLKHVQLGASPNVFNSNEWTPLMMFAVNGWTEGVVELLKRKASINVAEKDGWTPLMFASYKGNVEIVQALLAGKADFVHATKNGQTALSLAMARGHVAVAEALRKAGARDPVTAAPVTPAVTTATVTETVAVAETETVAPPQVEEEAAPVEPVAVAAEEPEPEEQLSFSSLLLAAEEEEREEEPQTEPVAAVEETQPTLQPPQPRVSKPPAEPKTPKVIKRSTFNARNAKKEEKKKTNSGGGFFSSFWK